MIAEISDDMLKNVSASTPSKSQGPETFSQKAVRHILGGDIAPSTLVRGIKFALDTYMAQNLELGNLKHNATIPDYKFHGGLTMTKYELSIPPPNELKALGKKDTTVYCGIFDYPLQSRVELKMKDKVGYYTDDFLSDDERAIAAFTGPTFVNSKLPNNGFFKRGDDRSAAFEDTNPSGQRRGAICFTDEGEMVLVDDQIKWELVRNDFKGVEALVGTSHYIKAGDSNELHQDEHGKSEISYMSYLMQYTDSNNKLRTAYIQALGLVSRVRIKQLIDDYTQRQNKHFLMAVEMEFNGSASYVKDLSKHNGYFLYGNQVRHLREDHYIVVRDASIK